MIVGKPNVGKSTLFNRLIKKRKSIVLDKPGITRDHLKDIAHFYDRSFYVIDTCGVFENPQDIVEQKMKEKVIDTMREASLLLFVVDGRKELTSEDYHLADLIRKVNIPTILVANKVENQEKFNQDVLPELYKLGFDDPIPVSSEHNKNIDTLFERIIYELENMGFDLKEKDEKEEQEDLIKVAIIGRPNVGKSSLFNCIVGYERAMVTDIPGTTRDSIDELVEINGNKFLFIDTAGLRRKSRIEYASEEMYSSVRSIRSIERADVVVVMVDATEGITHQDQKIAGVAENRGKASVVVFNKWDLVKYNMYKRRKEEYMKLFEEKFYFISYSPVVFMSALKCKGIEELFKAIKKAYDSYTRKVSTSAVNKALERFQLISPTPTISGKKLKFYFGAQVDIKPPVFSFVTNMPNKVPKFYQQGLRNMIRKYVDPFEGAPIFLKFKARSRRR